MISRAEAEAALKVLVEYVGQGPQRRTNEDVEREIRKALVKYHSAPTTDIAAMLGVAESRIIEARDRLAGR
jgi:hypothetical protein